MKILLFTAGEDLVREAKIPAFNEWPDVILWGTRVFTYTDEDVDDEKLGTMEAHYNEVFSYTLGD